MGYSYGRTPAGRQGLACDNCGQVGGVRKRTCPYKVRDVGMTLPFCTPPALCASCFTAEKGKTHAKCKEGAAASQADVDRKQARLDAGELLVRSAESGPSKGITKFWVSGKDGGREVAYLVATDVYRARHLEARGGGFFLADVPGAVPAECDHQPGQPACETFACGGTPPITTPLRNAYEVSVEPRPTECGADQTVRDLARAVEARTGLTVSAMRSADSGWADVNPGGRKINAWDFKAGTAHVRVLTYEARHALSRDPLRYAAVYVGQTLAAGAIDLERRPAAWMGEIVRAVAPLVEGLHDALQVATPAPAHGWLLKNPIIGANVEHSGLGLVEVVESREDGYTLLVKDALGRDHHLDRWGNGWWKVYPGGAALGGVDTPERFARRVAYRDHVIEYRHAKHAEALTKPARDCRTCMGEVTGAAELGTGHVWGRYVRFPWCLMCGVPATLTAKTTERCPGAPGESEGVPAIFSGIPHRFVPKPEGVEGGPSYCVTPCHGHESEPYHIHVEASAPEPEPEPDAPSGQAAPRKIPFREDNKAKRGDVLVIEKRKQVGTRDGRGAVEVHFEVHQVVSATRDGEPKRVRDLSWGSEYNVGKHRRDFQASRRKVIPGDQVNVDALHQALKAHTYPDSTTPKRPETRAEVRDLITPHLVEPGGPPEEEGADAGIVYVSVTNAVGELLHVETRRAWNAGIRASEAAVREIARKVGVTYTGQPPVREGERDTATDTYLRTWSIGEHGSGHLFARVGRSTAPTPAEPEVDRAQVAADMFERVSQALIAGDLDTAEKMVDAGEEYMPDFQPPGYGRWRYVRDEIAERRRVRKVNPRAYTAPAPEPEPEAEPEPWGNPTAEYAVGDRVTVLSGWQQELSAGVVAEVTRFDEHVVYTVNIPARAAAFLGAEKMRPDPTPAPQVGQVWVSNETGTRVKVTGVEPLSAVAHTDNLGDVILASPNWRPATDAELEPEPEPVRPDPWGPALRALGVAAASR